MSETDLYFRAFELCTKTGGKVIRSIVEDTYKKLGYASFAEFLNFDDVKHTLFHLWKKKCCCKRKITTHALNREQWQKIYTSDYSKDLNHSPDGDCYCQYVAPTSVTTDVLDISLCVVILSKEVIQPEPSPGDPYALTGIKEIRNELAHKSKMELDLSKFKEIWEKLCGHLRSLAKSLNEDMERYIGHEIIALYDKVYDSKDKHIITSLVESITEMLSQEETSHSAKLSGIENALANQSNKLSEILDRLSVRDADGTDSGKERASSQPAAIKIIIGDITKEQVDVIVNTTSADLNLSSGKVSKCILRAGGPIIQEELNKNYPDKVESGKVAKSSGGDLSCSCICHGWLPRWDKDKQCKQILSAFMVECLELASVGNFNSISFPALGTGILGYPPEVVAKDMYDTAANYFFSNQMSSLKEIHFVIFQRDEEAIKVFKAEESRRNNVFSKSQ